MNKISRKIVTQHARTLGVHVCCSIDELKMARNRLAKVYHPDKNSKLDLATLKILEARFNKIQDSYEYLRDNHTLIQLEFKHLEKFLFTHKGNRANASHWIYSEVESYSQAK